MMIEIAPYNPEWPLEFERLASAIRDALGQLAVRVDHIGSTSVPGLDAKDIIDIQISVRSFEPEIEERLAAAGYTRVAHILADHRPPYDDSPDEEWVKRLYHPPSQERPANIHMRMDGRANQRYALLFRDYLRARPSVAASYAELKRRLARYHGEDRKAYVEIKDPACDLILLAAEDWARETGWAP